MAADQPSFADALGSFVDQSKRLAAAEREIARLRQVEGRHLTELIDEMVALWHVGPDDGKELHEYLGMTWNQYGAWAKNPSRWIAAHGAAWFNDRFPEGETATDVPAVRDGDGAVLEGAPADH